MVKHKKLKSIAKSKRGDGYIDICIAVIAFVMMFIIAMQAFNMVLIGIRLNNAADQLIAVATYTGSFGDEFNRCDEALLEKYSASTSGKGPYYTISYGTALGTDTGYYNESNKSVQLGESMWIRVEKEVSLIGGALGQDMPIFKVTLNASRDGISEHYWK